VLINNISLLLLIIDSAGLIIDKRQMLMIIINIEKLIIRKSSRVNMRMIRRNVKISRNNRFIKIYLLEIIILYQFKNMIVKRVNIDESITRGGD
jgi:hypothetical protein